MSKTKSKTNKRKKGATKGSLPSLSNEKSPHPNLSDIAYYDDDTKIDDVISGKSANFRIQGEHPLDPKIVAKHFRESNQIPKIPMMATLQNTFLHVAGKTLEELENTVTMYDLYIYFCILDFSDEGYPFGIPIDVNFGDGRAFSSTCVLCEDTYLTHTGFGVPPFSLYSNPDGKENSEFALLKWNAQNNQPILGTCGCLICTECYLSHFSNNFNGLYQHCPKCPPFSGNQAFRKNFLAIPMTNLEFKHTFDSTMKELINVGKASIIEMLDNHQEG